MYLEFYGLKEPPFSITLPPHTLLIVAVPSTPADAKGLIKTALRDAARALNVAPFDATARVTAMLAERQKKHESRVLGAPQIGSFHSDRARLMESVPIKIRPFQREDLPTCSKLYREGLLGGRIAENDTGLDIDGYTGEPTMAYLLTNPTATKSQKSSPGASLLWAALARSEADDAAYLRTI